MYLQPERYQNKVKINRVTYKMFSLAKNPRHIINYQLKLTWLTGKISNKHHVRKSFCSVEVLWVNKIFLFQPESNIKQRKNTKDFMRQFFLELKCKNQS